ncbi:hypothetical protein SLEP1_g44867 [Rubroshorea leprosula]|uniref:Uncharacterized protein n=1 Tax=Rubroshorea leprosula TaxID=152421 RepID=A0AAV5LHG0_9ROSI|nr:hypothetical protein SLEP1_g44867 [Rubroshorea leprosula]
MSSERSESIVGSEVEPLDYGGMDSESSPSSTSSEETVEGLRGDEVMGIGGGEMAEVGRNEVVGVGVDSLPITVIEVENNGERGYDRNADIVEEVKQYRSELRTRDDLCHLVETYDISSRVLVRPAGVEERACSAPWDHWMPVYSQYLLAGLKFPLPELLIDKKESRILFTAGPSSIKGWKEKFFFIDDTEWGKGDAEVRALASWKAKRANQNKFSLNGDEEEEVRKLVRKRGDVLNIMDLTSAACIEAAELYGPSALSEADMNQFLGAAGGKAIPKKPRNKSRTSTRQVDEGISGKEVVPTDSIETGEEVAPLKRKGWEERRALEKKKKVVEEERSEVPEFVPQPPPVELNPELRRLEEGAEVRAPGRGKGPLPPLGPQSSLFGANNMTGARWFINNTFPEVDLKNGREEALRYGGASVVKHALENASWVNGLAQEFRESTKERVRLQRQCDQLQKEKEELEKKNKELQASLDEVVLTLKQLEQDKASLGTKLGFEETKRKISESEREVLAQELKLTKEAFSELKGNVQTLVHNGMEEHISNFISSSSFGNIVNLYRLPTAIIAFTDCRRKVKTVYPEVDVTRITFGEQEAGVEEDGESMSADFRPEIKLKWDHDADGRTVFPPNFDFEFVAVEEEGAEAEEDEVEAGVEGVGVNESHPISEVEIHPVPSDDDQPPLPDEQQPRQPPLPAEEELVEPPPPA